LYALKAKTAQEVYTAIVELFRQIGYPSKIGCDNGGEFKGLFFILNLITTIFTNYI
jgi:hypothetical protein